MIVVADASPIDYLIQVDAVSVLQTLFERVIVPRQVQDELKHSGAPAAVRRWMEEQVPWVEIREPQQSPDDRIRLLDPGEQAAILLAVEIGADLLLIDERRGRMAADERGLKTLGTIGVLLLAEQHGVLDALRTFDRLITETSFHAAPELREYVVKLIRKHRGRKQ